MLFNLLPSKFFCFVNENVFVNVGTFKRYSCRTGVGIFPSLAEMEVTAFTMPGFSSPYMKQVKYLKYEGELCQSWRMCWTFASAKKR